METAEKQRGRPFAKGKCPNPSGRPKGQRNYATLYRIALQKIGEARDMTPEQVEEELHQSGLDKALKGDYAFYRDTLDRLHGRPAQPADEGDSPRLQLVANIDAEEARKLLNSLLKP